MAIFRARGEKTLGASILHRGERKRGERGESNSLEKAELEEGMCEGKGTLSCSEVLMGMFVGREGSGGGERRVRRQGRSGVVGGWDGILVTKKQGVEIYFGSGICIHWYLRGLKGTCLNF